MEIMATLLVEGSKTVVSELCKAGLRALFSSEKQQTAAPDVESADFTFKIDPLQEAQWAADGFFQCLAAADHDAAWTWCDPAWLTDPERSPSFHQTFSYAPPLQWSVRQQYVPGDWTEGEWLGWVAMDVVVTFDNGDGTFSTHPAAVVAMLLDPGWRIAEVVWYPDSQAAPEQPVEQPKRIIRCGRCSQKLSIPIGVGRIRLKCPSCRTLREIDT